MNERLKIGDWVIGGRSGRVGKLTNLSHDSRVANIAWHFSPGGGSIDVYENRIEVPIIAKVCASCRKRTCPSIVPAVLNEHFFTTGL